MIELPRFIPPAAALAVAAQGAWIIWRHYDVLRPYTRPGCEGCVRRSLGQIVEAFRMRCIEGKRRRQLYYAWWLLWGSTLTTATFAAAWLRGVIEPQVLPSLGTMALVALTHRWFDNHFRSAEA